MKPEPSQPELLENENKHINEIELGPFQSIQEIDSETETEVDTGLNFDYRSHTEDLQGESGRREVGRVEVEFDREGRVEGRGRNMSVNRGLDANYNENLQAEPARGGIPRAKSVDPPPPICISGTGSVRNMGNRGFQFNLESNMSQILEERKVKEKTENNLESPPIKKITPIQKKQNPR